MYKRQIVTCGIVINDSILKLDAINELRKAGVPLLEAIHEAGRRRLRPIIIDVYKRQKYNRLLFVK